MSPLYPSLQKPSSTLKRALTWSLSAHGLFLLLACVSILWSPPPLPSDTPTLRIDLVALPEFTKAQMKRWKLKVFKKKPSHSLSKKKKRFYKSKKHTRLFRKALSKIKSLEKIESPPALVLKGNRLSQGTASTGAREKSQPSYLDQVYLALKRHWSLPIWLAREKHQTQVRIYIDAQGNIRKQKMVHPSSSKAFNQAVLNSIKQAAPFPPPPKSIVPSLLFHGILLGFPL